MDKSATKLLNSASAKFHTLSTNKYFLYFTAFLAITTVFGYLATNKVKAVVLLALIAMIVSKFTTNMSVVLLIAVLATNLLMSMRTVREGMEDASDSTSTEESVDNSDTENKMNPKQIKALSALKTEPTVKDAKKKITKGTKISNTITNVNADDVNADDVNADDVNTDESAPEPMTSMSRSQNNAKGASSRIDYASTLENAYSDLEKSLGAGGIKELTKDTSKLMTQQKELFQSMQQMAPLITDAKEMLKGFDMKSLTGLAGLATGVGGGEKEKENV
ncbi:hypothetical protein N9K75_00845 [bacterium]|nr:hypothetical protein [bacterium]